MRDEDKKDVIAIQLDADRRREINDVRQKFEAYWIENTKFQAEMKSDMATVKEQQKGLKERFEEGVSKRLAGLDMKFDKFLIEWGRKQEQDKGRDKAIGDVDKKADDNRDSLNWLVRSLIISVCSGLFLWAIMYGIQHFK